MPPISYKRIINEYNKLYQNLLQDEVSNYQNKKFKISDYQYQIHVINADNYGNQVSLYKTLSTFIYEKNRYKIEIYYGKNYPFDSPIKMEVNNTNINAIFKTLMNTHSELFRNQCLCCTSLLCSVNWNPNKNAEDLINECIKIINYRKLWYQKKLLKTICDKYSNYDLTFIENYLL